MATKEKTVKEPLFHVVKRDSLPIWKKLLVYAIAIVAALLIAGVFCVLTNKEGKGLVDFFKSVFVRSLKSNRKPNNKVWVFLKDWSLLLGVSFAIVPAFKMKFWNLGGNGQILVGCLACFACMFYGQKYAMPKQTINILMVISSITAGVVWAVIPAIFKAFFKTNESLFTLMMNYIAAGLVSLMITVWYPTGSGSVRPVKGYALPEIYNDHMLTIIVVVAVAILVTLYLRKSKIGFETALVGESENTAKYVGTNVKKVIIRTLIISGAICGLIGMLLSGSINHTVSENMANNMGFTAIMTVWLAKFNPFLMVVTCGLISFVSTGMGQVKRDFGYTNSAIVNVVLGVIYFVIIGCEFFISYKIVFRKKKAVNEATKEVDKVSNDAETASKEV